MHSRESVFFLFVDDMFYPGVVNVMFLCVSLQCHRWTETILYLYLLLPTSIKYVCIKFPVVGVLSYTLYTLINHATV